MKVSHYLRAQNFAAPSVNDNDSHKKSFRQNDDEMQMLCTNNIMFDSRVCRGNTYATPVFTEDQRRNQEVYERTQNARRSLIERQNNEKIQKPGTPPPVKGRVHAIIQTDGTLEDIFGSNDVIIIHDQMEEVKKDLSFMGISEEEEGEEGESIVSREHINEILSDEEKENDNRLIEKKEHNTFIDKDINISVETQLTKNLAKLIYDEAKNDALSRIEQDPPYYSDPER